MSLQFIQGNAGSGKSTYLYQNIIEEAIQHPKKNYLVVVPEQFTMHTQQQLVAMHPAHSIMNIDVLSFERMAYRVFDELGTDTLQVLEETGKHLLLRKIAQEQKEHLVVLQKNSRRPGYIAQIKSLISELMQYDISPETLEDMMECPGMQENFRQKAGDILVLYREYRSRLAGNYITAEEILQKLMDVADRSKILRGATVVFDGFTGFTPIQNQFLEMLFGIADKVMVTVTCEPGSRLFEEPADQDLFAMGKRMVLTLVAMAERAGCEIEPVICLEQSAQGRFRPGGYLWHLEQNLFRPGAKPFVEMEDPGDAFAMVSLSTPRQELTYVACEIEKQVREQGLHYGDFAVVCADMDTYAHLVPGIFDKLHIPYFLDAKAEIVFHPFIEAIKSLFMMVEENCSYESVMRLLRSGMTDLDTGEIDLLENYLLAANVRGFGKYRDIFTYIPMGYTPEQMVTLNEIRGKLAKPLGEFYERFPGKRGTVADISEALYRWILYYDIQRRLKQRGDMFEEMGEATKAREYQQIYGVVMDLLDKLVAILGTEEMSLTEYGELLATGFESLRIGVIPPGTDRVVVGDMERSRLAGIKVLYLVGACDGAIPKSVDSGGILTQVERQQLREADFVLAPTDREKAFMQRFYLYFVMTKPSDKLVVTYARVDNGGNATRRSYLIGVLGKLFPNVPVTTIESLPIAHQLLTPEVARDYLVEGLRGCARGEEVSQELLGLLAWEQQQNESQMGRLVEAAYYTHKKEQLSAAAVDAVFGKERFESVSRIEQYARCAYAYFVKYGLSLQPRQEYSFASVDMGTLYHTALEYYSKRLDGDTEVNWYTISQEKMEQMVREAILHTYQTMTKTQVMESARDAYILHKMEMTLGQTVWALTEQVRKGSFVPKAFEVSFDRVDDVDALKFRLDEMHSMRLVGKVDRVDLCETEDTVYVKIVDYKSGNKDVDLNRLYHGLQVQLVLYLNATMEGLKEKYPDKDIVPGAMFYYHIHRPFLSREAVQKNGREDALLKELQMRGVLNRDDAVVEAMHHGLQGKSNVIPAGRKADGTLDATTKALDREQFAMVGDYVNLLMQSNGERIIGGDIDCAPYKMGDETGCAYCEYHGICGFDSKMPGYDYRVLSVEKDRDRIVENMKTDLEKAKGRRHDEVDR
ncbi:MAG: exodeoxyribonuclease V subunit gamma [Lachnospiraceae bacterium]|nr:exodeoxyribonuclease V subunit gamma [Lachnospiraceae bacterium]